jgi:hypothetical protein
MLLLPAGASAAITIGFHVRSAVPGQRMLGQVMDGDGESVPTLGRRPATGTRVYLVRVADANRLGDPLRSGHVRHGPLRPDPRIHPIGRLRNEHGVGTVRFRLPALAAGRYTTLVWCIPCLPPDGSVFLSGWYPDGARTRQLARDVYSFVVHRRPA